MNEEVKQMFFKLLQENKEKLAELLSDDSDSESDTASVKSVTVLNTRYRPTRAPRQDVAGASKPDVTVDLMKELECPVCMQLMSPPIMMCYNGHNICSNCRTKLKKCPTCKKSFLKWQQAAFRV